MFEIGGGEGRVVSVRTFAVVVAAATVVVVVVALLVALVVVVAGCGLLGGFLGLGLWLRCILGACPKSVLVWRRMLEDGHCI